MDAEIGRVFEKVMRFFDDEAAQNANFKPEFAHIVSGRSASDEVEAPFGEFGKSLTNPIPVNGPLGEIIYLSRLNIDGGSSIAFHRLGSVNNVDVFEVVGNEGRWWDILYFDFYYPRKSAKLPLGYRAAQDWRYAVTGTTALVEAFPTGIYQAADDTITYLVEAAGAHPGLKFYDSQLSWTRPDRHIQLLAQLQFTTRPVCPARSLLSIMSQLYEECSEEFFDRLTTSFREWECSPVPNWKDEAAYLVLYMLHEALLKTAPNRTDIDDIMQSLTESVFRKQSPNKEIFKIIGAMNMRLEQLGKLRYMKPFTNAQMDEASFRIAYWLTGERLNYLLGVVFTTYLTILLSNVIEVLEADRKRFE